MVTELTPNTDTAYESKRYSLYEWSGIVCFHFIVLSPFITLSCYIFSDNITHCMV